jgi:hypothetical protein
MLADARDNAAQHSADYVELRRDKFSHIGRKCAMKYLLLIVNRESDWQALSPAEQEKVIAGMNRFDDQLRSAGKFVSCGGLAPSTEAQTVRLTNNGRTVSGGPAFKVTPGGELVTGFFVIQTGTIDEAVEWATKMPIIAGAIEVRPIAME